MYSKLMKMKSILALALLVSTGSSLVFAENANATLVLGLASVCPICSVGWAALGAVIIPEGFSEEFDKGLFATFVILDQELTSLPPLTEIDLTDNGYSSSDAKDILNETQKLNEKLAMEKKVISLSSSASLTEIRAGLKAIMPDASDKFLDVFSERLSLIAQARK